MSLTDDEARRLDEMASELRSTDPKLCRKLAGRERGRDRLRPAAVVLAVVAAAIIVAGAATEIPFVCLIAWFTLLLALVCSFASKL